MKRSRIGASIALTTGCLMTATHVASVDSHSSGRQGPHPAARAPSGLILGPADGERMTRRRGLPMTIKIDPRNGVSTRLVVGTEDLPPGQSVPVHRHAHCDEVVIVQQGSGIARLGDRRQAVSAGAMIFEFKE